MAGASPSPEWRGALADVIDRLARSWTRRRARPSLRDPLRAFNDHMLADVGLSLDARALRGVRSPDPWFLAAHLR